MSALERGERVGLACQRIGPPLLFERLWSESGCRAVIADLVADRGFEFAVERTVFVAVLHRLMVSGSDRACEKWMRDYRIEGAEALLLHHFYRAMTWLGEEPWPGWGKNCLMQTRPRPPRRRAASRT